MLQGLLQHSGGNGHVGGDKHQHGRHVGVDHAAALGDAAQVADLAADLKLNGDLFFNGIGGHDALGSGLAAVLGKACGKRGQTVCDGLDVQRLTNDTGGGHHHVGGGNVQLLGHQIAHALGDLDAVGVAGIGIAAVADHGLCKAVGNVVLGHGQGGTLDQIGGVNGSSGGAHVADDQRQVTLGAVLANAAMNAVCLKTLCGTNAAGNDLHSSLLFIRPARWPHRHQA